MMWNQDLFLDEKQQRDYKGTCRQGVTEANSTLQIKIRFYLTQNLTVYFAMKKTTFYITLRKYNLNYVHRNKGRVILHCYVFFFIVASYCMHMLLK